MWDYAKQFAEQQEAQSAGRWAGQARAAEQKLASLAQQLQPQVRRALRTRVPRVRVLANLGRASASSVNGVYLHTVQTFVRASASELR